MHIHPFFGGELLVLFTRALIEVAVGARGGQLVVLSPLEANMLSVISRVYIYIYSMFDAHYSGTIHSLHCNGPGGLTKFFSRCNKSCRFPYSEKL